MDPETSRIFVGLFTLWGVAVAIKAALSLKSGGDYVFSIWDGGMIRAGKRLNTMGKWIKLVVGIAMAILCALSFAGAMDRQTAFYALIFVALMSIISDFVTIAS